MEPRGTGAMVREALRNVESGVPVALLIRHAARESFEGMRFAPLALLSPAGETAARDFGVRFPPGRRLIAHHSHVERCRQTAELLVEGYRATGGEARVAGGDPVLTGSYIRSPEALVTLADELGPRFVRAWLDGKVDPEVIAPICDAARWHLEVVRELLAQAAPHEAHVLVTHDWNILAVREALLGLRHEEVGWPEFLDGPLFVPRGDRLKARCCGLEFALD